MSGVTQVSEHTFEIGGMGASVPQEASQSPTILPVVRHAPTPVALATVPGGPLTLGDLLRDLKARRKAVRAELKTKAKLESELAQLERLIRAATTELDNVRRLRAAG